jgi:P4 family phage/plasmid primase-like protien
MMEESIFFWTEETERPQPRRILNGKTVCPSCQKEITPNLKSKIYLCENCNCLLYFSLDYKEALISNSKLRQSKKENQSTPVDQPDPDPGALGGKPIIQETVENKPTVQENPMPATARGEAISEDEKNIYSLYLKNGFLPLFCNGYHPKHNREKDREKAYKLAKEPTYAGWNKPDYVAPTLGEIGAWEKAGGWIGWRIPEGSIYLDVEDKEDTAEVREICHLKGINPGVHCTNKGFHFGFITDLKLPAASIVFTKSGIRLTYRIGGKNYLILAPTNNRRWEVWKDIQFSPALPDQLIPYDRKNIEDVLNCLSHSVRTAYREGNFSGYEDLDAAYMALLIDCKLSEEMIRGSFRTVFRNEYSEPQTRTMCERTRTRIEKGDPVIGTGTFIQRVKDKDLKEVLKFARDLKTLSDSPTNGKSDYLDGPHLTDMGNASRFVQLHGHEVRYCFPEKVWYYYDGKRWTQDKIGRLYEMGKDVVIQLLREASEERDQDRRKNLSSHAFKCEAEAKNEAMLKSARSKLPILPIEFDRDPWLFNCQNGTINLRTGILQPHNPDDFITRISSVEYDPEATCPSWLEHLNKIMVGNPDLIGFLQRWSGYCLTGITDERCLAILYGVGANGKTTFIETVAETMGDYSQGTRAETILVKRDNSASNDIAVLKGSRFVYSCEAEQDKMLAESLVKSLTGGDTVNARFLYQESFEYKPTYKLNLSTNHKPIIRGQENAIWDRIRLIPFNVIIPQGERKPQHEMMAIFREEASGILTWMAKGCLEWQNGGLRTPEEVQAATRQYRSDMDLLGEFIEDRCIEGAFEVVSKGDFYAGFKSWAESVGFPEKEIWKMKTLTMRMGDRGFKEIRESHTGTRKWKGISLRNG